MKKGNVKNNKMFNITESFNPYGEIETICNGFDVGYEHSNEIQSIVIPDEVDIIRTGAFENLSILELQIGKNLKSIEHNAFKNCEIKNIVGFEKNLFLVETEWKTELMKTEPELKTEPKLQKYKLLFESSDPEKCIGIDISKNELIEKLVIPEGTISIKSGAFKDYKIKKLVLPSNNKIIIGSFAFDSCSIEEVVNMRNIESLGIYAFQKNLLKKVDITGIRNAMLQSSEGAFHNNQIEEIKICHSVKNIPTRLFCNNNIKKVDFPNIIGYGNESFAQNQISFLKLSNKTERIHMGAFNDNNLKYINLPPNIKEVDRYAFYNNDTKVVILLRKYRKSDDDNDNYGNCFQGNNIENVFDTKLYFENSKEGVKKHVTIKGKSVIVTKEPKLNNISIEEDKVNIQIEKGIPVFHIFENGIIVEKEYNETTKKLIDYNTKNISVSQLTVE